MWEDLVAHVHAAGYALHVVDEIDAAMQTNGQTDFLTRRITIATVGRDPANRARTLAHELAHALLHEGEHNRAIAEVEAEAVAFLVSDAYGMDASAYTVPYLTAWGASDPDAVLRTAGRVQRCATTILAARFAEAATSEVA
jgi:hypothetical protein